MKTYTVELDSENVKKLESVFEVLSSKGFHFDPERYLEIALDFQGMDALIDSFADYADRVSCNRSVTILN